MWSTMNLSYFRLCLALLNFVCVHTHEDHHHGISENEHYEKGKVHNTDYDHDAFLGKGHGHDFDSLEPEEAKRRLKSMLVKKVDKNVDGFVEFEELREWIDHQRTAYMWDNIDMVIRRDDDNKDGYISWDEYKHAHYGKWDDDSSLDQKLRKKIENDENKFKLADGNKDGKLSRDEYVYFRHPEESMNSDLQEVGVDEVTDEMDQDGDKTINLDEFLGQYVDDTDEPPYWVIEDRKHFAESLDHDKNGILDRDEMRTWVLPDKKETEDEAKHLIRDSDDNNDGRLSFEEILDHYHMFVGSTVTDHGKALRNEL